MVSRRKGQMRRCIYCLKHKYFIAKKKSGSQFSREHVINEAFVQGFSENSQTLVGLVCHDCNQSFKKTLDDTLTRKGLEGLIRLSSGAKSIELLSEFHSRNNVLQLKAHVPESAQHAAPVSVVNKANRVDFDLPSCISYKEPGSDNSTHMSISEFALGGWKSLKGRALEVSITAENEEEMKLINNFLEMMNVPHVVTSIGKAHEEYVIPVSLEIAMTEFYQRALAKTAFNYLAYTTHKRLPGYIFSEQFHEIRAFIRYGTLPKLVPIEKMEDAQFGILERREGFHHRLSLGRGEYQGKHILTCDVQINSAVIWRVYLCDDLPKVNVLTGVAHLWNCDTKKIVEESNEATFYNLQAPRMNHSDLQHQPMLLVLPTREEIEVCVAEKRNRDFHEKVNGGTN